MTITRFYCRILQTVALVSLLAGCEKKASDEIDFGTVNNSVYHNKFFGMSVTIPADWSVQDQAAQQRLMKVGQRALAGDDKNMQAVMKASEMQTVNLFAAYKYPLGSAVTFNPAILSAAEKVSQLPGIKRGKDYLFHTRQILESGQMNVSFPKEVYSLRLGGMDFDVMEVEFHVRGVDIREAYYSTIIKGYALTIISTFSNDEGEKAGKAILDTVKIQ